MRFDGILERGEDGIALKSGANPPSSLSDPPRPPQGWNLVDSILAELERQDEDVRNILRTAAVLREPFRFHLVSEAASLTEERADRAVEALVRMGLFEETGEFFRISSAQLRQRLASDLTDRTRKRVHTRIAEVVKDPAERGRHLALAGQAEEGAALLSIAARQAHDRGLYDEACSLWEACPDSPRTAAGRARSMAAAGRVQEALDLLVGRPPDPEVLTCQAELKIRQGAFDEAYGLCKAAGAPALLALVYERQGNLEAATQALTGALEAGPSDERQLRERLARLQLRQGRSAEALRLANQGLDAAKTSEEKLSSLRLLAEVQRDPARLTEARALAEEADWPDEVARLDMQRAEMLENEGDLPAAAAARERAVEGWRAFGESAWLVESLALLGQTYQAMAQPGPAEAALREAVSLSDRTGDKAARSLARRALGTFLLENRNLEAGALALQEAVDLAEGGSALAEALSELSVSHRRLDRFEGSLLAAEKAVVVARTLDDPPLLGKGLVTLGEACIARKKWKTGLEALQEAQNLIPSNRKDLYPRLLEALAELHAQGARHEYPGFSAAEADRYGRIARGIRQRGKSGISEPASQETRRESLVRQAARLKPGKRTLAIVGLVLACLALGLAWMIPARRGHLAVESQPTGATVVVKDARGTAPLSLKLPAGSYDVKLQLKGYKDYLETVRLESGQDLKLLAHLEIATGSLSLTSDPPGARVLLDGKESGVTPLLVEGLTPADAMTVLLSSPGYKDYTGTVAVVAGKERDVNVSLAKKPVPQPAPRVFHPHPHSAAPARRHNVQAKKRRHNPFSGINRVFHHLGL